MIAKVIHGGDVDGLIRYLYSDGRANEHVDPRLIDGWRPPETIEPHVTAAGNRDLRLLSERLRTPVQLMPTPRTDYVWHLPISAAKQVSDGAAADIKADRALTDAEFSDLARDILDRTGIAPRGDQNACRWVLVRHGGNHAHLVATLARQDGRRCDPANDYKKIRRTCRDFEDRHPELRRTRASNGTANKRASRDKVEKAARLGERVPAMEVLQREAYTARAAAANTSEFLRRLSAGSGADPSVKVSVRVEGHAGMVDADSLTDDQLAGAVGYAVHRVGDVDGSGRPIYYRGGRLGQDLSLPSLKEHWRPKNPKLETAPPTAAKGYLRAEAIAAATSSGSWEEYVNKLKAKGIIVKERHSVQESGRVTGYALGLEGHCDPETSKGMVPGSRLKDDGSLSYQRLLTQWRAGDQPVSVQAFDAEVYDPQERLQWYREASRVSKSGAERLRTLQGSDPAAAADAACATADLLQGVAGLAEGAEGGPITDAAQTFRSTAREINRTPASPGPGGRALRMVGRTAFLLRSMGEGEEADWARTVLSTCMLIRAVGEYRALQGRLEDQNAAVRACEKLELSLGIHPTADPWWKQAQRHCLMTATYPPSPKREDFSLRAQELQKTRSR